MSDNKLFRKAYSEKETHIILTLSIIPLFLTVRGRIGKNKPKLFQTSRSTHLQTSCSKTVAKQQDPNDATVAFPTAFTAEFDTEKRTDASSNAWCPGAQRPPHSGEVLHKVCQRAIAEHIEMRKMGPSGASCFCFLMVMDSAAMLMFALKALSAIFCSLNNSLF